MLDEPRFIDRRDAGRVLARALEHQEGEDLLVLGIPRGGIPVAAEVALALDAELDVVAARKIGAPSSPELAIGAVTADGALFLNEPLIDELGVPDPYIEAATERERAEALRLEAQLRRQMEPPRMRGRVVAIVDDGLATGATVVAAARSVRARGAARVIVATPVGSRDACEALAKEADEVVCPYRPEPFYAVGFYYQDFRPTLDIEVEALLAAAHTRRQ